jgi:hypothetical protein
MEEYLKLWGYCREAFARESSWERAVRLSTGMLLCLGRHTVTGLITTTGGHARDWSADYRVFERERFDAGRMFSVVRRETVDRLEAEQPVVTFMDDTLLKRRGQKVSGTSWHRDANGPKFCCNFVWAGRYLQISGALPEEDRPGSCRGIPFLLKHCPIPKRPSKRAPDCEWDEYWKLRDSSRISVKGAEAICNLREGLDNESMGGRQLVVSVDGGYTNSSVVRALPERTTLIGRIRKDAKLYARPEDDEPVRRGRKRFYGRQLPTPEDIRQGDEEPWQDVEAFSVDRTHTFRLKVMRNIRSKIAGERNLCLVIIQPLRYRLTKKSRLLYRNPAYLICTDPELDVSRILQWYLWRWQIEVNFRDQKSLLGMDESSVRTAKSVEKFPELTALSYAFLQLASTAPGVTASFSGHLPKWRGQTEPGRMSTGMMITEMRNAVWGLAVNGKNLGHFVNRRSATAKLLKFRPSLETAVLYAHR